MIIAIEGPDGCGKSTLHAALLPHLPGAKFVPSLPYGKELMPVMEYMEARAAALWEALYDPSQLYVCDRHFSVSNVVYGALYGRRQRANVLRWVPEVRVVYLDVPTDELVRRHAERGDELFDAARYSDVRLQYSFVLRDFKSVVFDGTHPVELLAQCTLEAVRLWRNCNGSTASAG